MPTTSIDHVMAPVAAAVVYKKWFPHMDDDTLRKASRSFYDMALETRNRLRAKDILSIDARSTDMDVATYCKTRKWAHVKKVQKAVKRIQAATPAGVPKTIGGITTRRSAEPPVPLKNCIKLAIQDITTRTNNHHQTTLLMAFLATQNWPYLQVVRNIQFNNGSTGRGVVTLCPIEKGMIVCDYHGSRVSFNFNYFNLIYNCS